MIKDHSSCIRVSDTVNCKYCQSKNIIKNGKTKTRKQQYFCKNCSKRFIEFYTYKAYSKNINTQIIQFIKGGLGIRSIAGILQISTTTLLKRIISISNKIPQPAIPLHQSYELDEMRFFIGNKSNLMWLVYAINKNTKEIADFHIGKRTNKTLNKIIKTLINSKTEKIFTE